MLAVIFEVIPTTAGKEEYLSIAASLRQELESSPGFISIERFQSLADKDKILSLSFWENEESVTQWRNSKEHRLAQTKGRNSLFRDYRIRIGRVVRDYSLAEREQSPEDSRLFHD